MRMTILATAVLASPVQAADLCGDRNGDLLSLDSWSVEMVDDGYGAAPKITVTASNRSDRNVRMVDASVIFEDALGGNVTNFALPRDIHLEADTSLTEGGIYPGAPGMIRMAKSENPDDFNGAVCVNAVLFEDGEKQFFPPKD